MDQGTACPLLFQSGSPSLLILPSCFILLVTYILCVIQMLVAFAVHFDCDSFGPHIRANTFLAVRYNKHGMQRNVGYGRKVTRCTLLLLLLFICPD